METTTEAEAASVATSGVASMPSARTDEGECECKYDADYAAALAASEEAPEAMQTTTTTTTTTTDDEMDDADYDAAAIAMQGIEIKSSPLETYVGVMNQWFENSGSDETDEMTARQLDHIFQYDNFGSQWWYLLRSIEFKYVVSAKSYLVPESSAPLTLQNKYYSAKDIYRYLDTFSVPYVTSAIEKFAENETQELLHTMTEDEIDFWKDVRDVIVFLKYRLHIDTMHMNNSNNGGGGEKKKRSAAISSSSVQPQKNTNTRRQKQKRATTTSRRSSSRLASAKTSNNTETQDSSKTKKAPPPTQATQQQQQQQQPGQQDIRFPTVQEYVTYVQNNYDYDTVKQNEASYRGKFDEWRYKLYLNHSLLFYGVGSKRHFLNTFSKELDDDGDVLTLDGFDKEITIEAILDLVVGIFLKGIEPTIPDDEHEIYYHNTFLEDEDDDDDSSDDGGFCGGNLIYPSNNTVKRAMLVAMALSEQVTTTFRPVYIILHNIDGEALRNSTAQEALSVLVHCSVMPGGKSLNAVRLVASVDHVDAPTLLWDSLTTQRFRWMWNQVNTHRPFIEEITESSLGLDDELQQQQHKRKLTQQKRGTAGEEDDEDSDDDDDEDDVEADILNVLKSLAPRPTESLQVLANLQLSCSTLTQYTGEAAWVEYSTLLKKCQLECLITGDHQLRLFLKEFADHEIIEWKGTAIRIPYSTDTLLEIINFQHDNDD